MLEGSVMEVVKWFTYLMMFFSAIAAFIFFYQVGQTNRFEGFVDTQIERYGGLTPEAVANIEAENENYYNGRYVVHGYVYNDEGELTQPEQNEAFQEADHTVMSEPLAYGDVVEYDVHAKYPILFDWVDPIEITTSGQAVVQVRGSAGSG